MGYGLAYCCCGPDFVNVIKYDRLTGDIIWQKNPICGDTNTTADPEYLTTYSMARVVFEPTEGLLWVVTSAFRETPGVDVVERLVALTSEGVHSATVIDQTPVRNLLYQYGTRSPHTLVHGGGYPVIQGASDNALYRANADGTIAGRLSFSPMRDKWVSHSSGDMITSYFNRFGGVANGTRRNDWSGVESWNDPLIMWNRAMSIDAGDIVLMVAGTRDTILAPPDWTYFYTLDGATGVAVGGSYTSPSHMLDVAALSSGFVVSHIDAQISIIGSDGNLLSSFTDAYGVGQVAADDDLIIVAGAETSGSDVTVRAYDHTGNLLWRQKWVRESNPCGVALDGDGNVVAVGNYGRAVTDPL